MASTRKPRRGARVRKAAPKNQRQQTPKLKAPKLKRQAIGGIADYSIGKLIGRGLVGPVRRGRYLPTGVHCALEEIPAELRQDPAFLEALGEAGRRVSKVRDSSLVGVYDLVEDGQNDLLYLVTDVVGGASLTALALPRTGLEPRQAATLIDGILAALEVLHAAGIAHGGVSRQTLMVTTSGRVRLGGLALAGILSSREGRDPQTARDIEAAARLGLELLTDPVPGQVRRGRRRAPRRMVTTLRAALGPPAKRPFSTVQALRAALRESAQSDLAEGWRSRTALARLATTHPVVHSSGTTFAAVEPAVTHPAVPGRRPVRRALVAGGVVLVPIAAGAGVAAAATGVFARSVAPGPLSVRDVAMSVGAVRAECGATFAFTATGDVRGTGVLVYRWSVGRRTTGAVSLPVKSSDAGFAVSQAWRFPHGPQSSAKMTFELIKPVHVAVTRTVQDNCR